MKRFLFITLLLSVVWSLSAQDKVLAIRNNLLQEGNNSVLGRVASCRLAQCPRELPSGNQKLY